MPSKFEAEVAEAFEDLEEDVMDIIQDGVERGLKYLETESPIWSGWYQRNHRVSIDDPDVKLDPPQKPNDDNVRFGQGELAVQGIPKRERPKLEAAKLGQMIYVANATDHAGIIEEEGTKRNPSGGWYSKAALVIANRIQTD